MTTANAAAALPRPAHVVVVIEENHSYSQIIGSSSAPYISSLAAQGASFTNSHAITHPSEPNYLALFSGSTQGVTDDSCPHTFSAANLGAELISAGLTFAAFPSNYASLLIVTWDENDGSAGNQIPTIFAGASVKTGTYSENINHYNVLRTLEDFYGLPHAGASASATPITDIFG